MIKAIKKLIFGNTIDTHDVPEHKESTTNELREKENVVFGQDELQLQRLYEKWAVKDFWNLKTEAIPLVYKQDPENIIPNAEYQQQADDLFEHAKHCIEAKLSLSVKDKTTDESDWQVVPLEFYTWAAVSRVEMPDRLTGLMDFIASTVMVQQRTTDMKDMPPVSPQADAMTQEFEQQNQMILGAAIKALLNHYDECQNSKGRIRLNTLVDCLEKHQQEWFTEDEFTASRANKEDVLRQWLN